MARAIRNAIRANRFARIIRNSNPYFYSANRLIRTNHSNFRFMQANQPICANRANRFARITPLSPIVAPQKNSRREKGKIEREREQKQDRKSRRTRHSQTKHDLSLHQQITFVISETSRHLVWCTQIFGSATPSCSNCKLHFAS